MSGNKGTIDRFHRLYWEEDLQHETRWLGHKLIKTPNDAWAMQEIIFETRPTLLVETGSFEGGSALYYANLFDLLYDGQSYHNGRSLERVLSIDLIPDDPERVRPEHPRIEYIEGASSIDPAVLALVRKEATGERVMIVLDSDHSCDHVLQELRAYAPLVSRGCYLVCEDSNVNGNPVARWHGPGPHEALKAFQPTNHGFEIDRSREKHLLSFHPGGFLRRVR